MGLVPQIIVKDSERSSLSAAQFVVAWAPHTLELPTE
jgi:hypothetical protein